MRGKERAAGWAGLVGWVWLWFGLGSFLVSSSLLFLILTQTKLDEFKLNFEFYNLKHTSKNKNIQHECNIKSRSMIDFNYLREKFKLNAILSTIILRKFIKAN